MVRYAKLVNFFTNPTAVIIVNAYHFYHLFNTLRNRILIYSRIRVNTREKVNYSSFIVVWKYILDRTRIDNAHIYYVDLSYIQYLKAGLENFYRVWCVQKSNKHNALSTHLRPYLILEANNASTNYIRTESQSRSAEVDVGIIYKCIFIFSIANFEISTSRLYIIAYQIPMIIIRIDRREGCF